MHNQEYMLAKPLAVHPLSRPELERIASEHRAQAGLVLPTVTVYPAGKRRRRLQTEAKGTRVQVSIPKPTPTGSLLAPARLKLGNGVRQANWDAIGSGSASLSGRPQKMRDYQRYDLIETAPWIDSNDVDSYRFDHRLSAYAHAEYALTKAEKRARHLRREYAYGPLISDAEYIVHTTDIETNRTQWPGNTTVVGTHTDNRVQVASRRHRPNRHGALNIPDVGLCPGTAFKRANFWPAM